MSDSSDIMDFESTKTDDKSSSEKKDGEIFGFDYHLSDDEVKSLAKFFRKFQSYIPEELEGLSDLIESKIYDSMTISEVMNFYS